MEGGNIHLLFGYVRDENAGGGGGGGVGGGGDTIYSTV